MKRADEIQSDLREMERDLALTPAADAEYFTWKNALVPCCRRAEQTTREIDLDGNTDQIAFSILVNRLPNTRIPYKHPNPLTHLFS